VPEDRRLLDFAQRAAMTWDAAKAQNHAPGITSDHSRMKDARTLARFIAAHPKLTVLSGAGCSTASGIPGYRDDNGDWMHARPVQYPEFVSSPAVRRRYWARSYAGWRSMSQALPNPAHRALAALEERGYVRQLITQNVDNLHRRAGSRRVIDLHGVLQTVRCLDCSALSDRNAVQRRLEALNPDWVARVSGIAPDGDAHVDPLDAQHFRIPSCAACGGVLKPDVVFFGENVPKDRVERCRRAVAESDALLVVGSSLMVFSGFRFAREASAAGKPVVIVNRGKTRADRIATIKLAGECGELLTAATAMLAA
jgi:NAD-dependent SIR2 family protein deacetylase